MITALILLSIALIICLLFMGITTWMYLNLEKDFQKQKLAMQSFATQFDLFCADITEQHGKAKEMNESTDKLLSKASASVKEANRASEFAMKTIQEVRKMLKLDPELPQRIVYENGKPKEIRSLMEGFKYEEKEEDPEKPRS